MDKKQIANMLEEMAFLLEFHGENVFKIRAFQNAARALGNASEPLEVLLEEPGRLEQIKGIGKSIAANIREYATTGRCNELEELRKKAPKDFENLIRVPGLGPKRLRVLVDELGIQTLEQLERACRTGEVTKLPGFGEKTVEKLLAGIAQVRSFSGQWLFPQGWEMAIKIVEDLKSLRSVKRIEIAGSLRRRKEVVRDIDILVATTDPEPIAARFVANVLVQSVVAQGDTKISVVLTNGMQADLRMVKPDAFPFALQYFTGSKEHNTHLRARAKKLGYRLNEYGLFPEDEKESARAEGLASVREEEDIYRALGLQYVPPELREDLGEIEAAQKGELPTLVSKEDYRGILHCHTNWSDGADTIEEMARQARRLWNAEYIAICDHSQSASYARGLDPERLRKQLQTIASMNKLSTDIVVLGGTECDILPDGSLDFPGEVLDQLDFVVVSIHSHFNMSKEQMTQRICRALEHPCADVLGHVSGRLLLMREPYALDLDKVLDAAARCRTIIEINGDPYRLDLDWRFCRAAKERGILFAVNPDAHSVGGLRNIEFGMNVARKGWLTRSDVVNCLSRNDLLTLIRENRNFRRRLAGRGTYSIS
ncbi:MAG: DNA polymerase/3'-5' exonuclease PolX [Candidatus Sumerlaeaceae bacterium]|nr:DNA polymerase/3'-5' exonuclease PolX [Candidatus Sumerlaeaceae bacterium]